MYDARSEYDAYIGGIYQLLAAGASVEAIAAHLAKVERDSFGFTTTAEALLPVGKKLKQVDARLVVDGPPGELR